MLPDVRCVLFDLDGTLIDSAGDLGRAADQMRVARGLASLPETAYRAWAGAGARGMLQVAFGMAPDDPRFEDYRAEFLLRYETVMLDSTAPFEGVAPLLARLEALDLCWGVVTNKFERFTGPLVAAMPLFDSAAVIVSGDTTPHMKPHPASLHEAMRRAGVAAAHCIYVGDDERDMQAGRAAGVRTVAARYGYLGVGARVEQWEPDAVIDRPLELLKLLQMA
ncbi:MAG TPA: HAD-IA family hydrolase [Ottowia sp.]|uniref:HAD-IA family hydrolase n=1 Tax=Ottowia sp. TaxID=1898956 RepID=UPI002C75765B|nr:HAD-IA family hydrolase [Ottowia sp.]HMN20594.1 HAD-IA family hydrolase [Ottowia sp.]